MYEQEFNDYCTDKKRRCSLKRTAKTVGISKAYSIAINALATCFNEDYSTLTLVARVIGQAMDVDASDSVQIKIGGYFINFLDMQGVIIFNQLSTDTYEISLEPGAFKDYVNIKVREKRVAAITEKPDDWHKPFNRGVPIVKKLSSDDAHHYTIDKMPMVYKALNILHSTEWMVNSDILQVMQRGLPNFNPIFVSDEELEAAREDVMSVKKSSLRHKNKKQRELKVKYQGTKAEASIGTWAKQSARNVFKTYSKDSRKVLAAHSKQVSVAEAIELAEAVEHETLYFQHNCCSRSRVYTLSNKLSPQGDDYQKALLRFANPGPIDYKWICMHIANCAGKDKLSYAGRVEWVEDNQDSIFRIGIDPFNVASLAWLEHNEIHKEIKSRYQFIAACMEFVHYYETGEWRIPVGKDQTSSGLQFLSAIARDDSIAEDVNISACSYAPVGDLYQKLGDAVIRMVDLGKAPSLSGLDVGDKCLRKLVKRSCMVFPYSCGASSMGEHTYDDRGIYGNDALNSMDFGECSYLGEVMYGAIKQLLPRAAAVMDAMQAAFDVGKYGRTIYWTTPTGFRAYQDKPTTKKSTVDILFDKRPKIQLVIHTPTNNPSKRSHQSGISPQLIHSMDASMLIMTICALGDSGITDFQAIHDCYCVHPGHLDVLDVEVRKAFYNIVKDDPVKRMMDEAVPGAYVSPEKGNWDVSDVLCSPYFVC